VERDISTSYRAAASGSSTTRYCQLLRTGQDRRTATRSARSTRSGVGATARERVEEEINRLAITADLLERRIDALDSRADEVYRKWRNEYRELRYRAPNATRLFQVAFRIAPMNQKA
jgi:hypothetical protein